MGQQTVSKTQRARALALLDVNISIKTVVQLTGLARSTVFAIRDRARQHGYDLASNHTFQDEWFEDAPRTGRPKKIDKEKSKSLIGRKEANRYGREMATV